MKAIEVFQGLLVRIALFTKRQDENVPGAIVKKLSEEQRQSLSELKSDEIGSNVLRADDYWYGDDQYYKNREIKKELLSFDKKILKR